MRKAIFIAGFNNWGKTTIMYQLFGRKRFLYGKSYTIDGIHASFTVESHSNDDLWGKRWRKLVKGRLDLEIEADLHLFAAVCPTIHNDNDFRLLLSQPPFDPYGELHILLLEFKFDHHAKLMIDNITQAGGSIPNAHFHVINADALFTDPVERANARLVQVIEVLRGIFS